MSTSRLRPAGVLLLALAGLLAASTGPQAQSGGLRGEVITRGAAPFTDTWAAIEARSRRLREERGAGIRPWPMQPPRPGRIRVERQPAPDGQAFFQPPAGPDAPRSPERRAPQTIATSFNAIGFQDQVNDLASFSFPPDTMGAVGPDHFVQNVNGSVAVFSKTGTRLSHVDMDAFFAVMSGGETFPRNSGFDPRIVFDRRSNRWFATTMDRGNPVFTDNDIVLAVSRTSNPLGTWDKYVLPVGVPTAGTTFFTDYSTLGVDDNGVYVGMTIFPSAGAAFSKVAVTPKAPLIAMSPSLGTVTQFSNLTGFFSSPQPAFNLDAVGPTDRAWFVTSSDTTFANVHFRSLTWSGGVPTLSGTGILSTPAYANPENFNAPASGSGTNVDTGDDRLMMAVIRNGRLWTARTVGVNASGLSSGADRTGCEWFELGATTASLTLIQNGRVFDNAVSSPRFYYYPSIMPSGQGHALIGFSGSKGSEFVGAYLTGRLSSDPPNTMGTIALIKAGDAAYTINDSQGRNRWGDYSYTSLDPNDDMTLWTIQEFAAPAGMPVGGQGITSRWGNFVARTLAPAPTLNNPAASGMQGQSSINLPLTGTGFFDPGPGFANRLQVQVTGGAVNGIQNLNVVFNSPTSVTVTFDVAANASVGPRNIVLTNPDGQSVTVVGGFTVAGDSFQFTQVSFDVPEAGGPAVLAITRSGDTGAPASVDLVVTPGTASAFADFTPIAMTVDFGAGVAMRTVAVGITPDNLLEGTETAQAELSNPVGHSLGTPSVATINILDDVVTPTPGNLTAAAFGTGQVQLNWEDRCGNETGVQVQRRVGMGAFTPIGTAPAGATGFVDMTAPAGQLLTYRVRAEQGINVSGFSDEVSLIVTTLQFQSLTVNTGEGNDTVTVTVVRSGNPMVPATVSFQTVDGSALSPNDFSASAGVLDFAPGVTERTIDLSTAADALLEPEETFTVELVAAMGQNVVIGPQNIATVRIADDRAATAPTGLTAKVLTATQVRLGWTDECDNEAAFRVERQQEGQGFLSLGTTAGVEFVDSTAPPGVALTYRVFAQLGGLESDPSGTAAATIPVGGKAKLSTRKLAFGKVKVGATKTKSVRITNVGRGSLAGTVPPLQPPFVITAGGGNFLLAPRASRLVTVQFTPPNTKFQPPANLRVDSTDVAKPSQSVRVTGRGRP